MLWIGLKNPRRNRQLAVNSWRWTFFLTVNCSILLFFTSCKSDKTLDSSKSAPLKNISGKSRITRKKLLTQLKQAFQKKYEDLENMFRLQLRRCEQKFMDLKNTPCKPEKIIQIQKENVYLFKTIGFKKYKKLLESKLLNIKNLKKREEIAEKLFFVYLGEKNWTKAYDLYKAYLEKHEQSFFNLLLAYIYLNNAENVEAKKILTKYEDTDKKLLKIKLAKFAKKITAYGMFEPLPNVLKKGSSVILYILLGNVKLIQAGSDFRVNLTVRISISRKKEKFVLLDEENTSLFYKHNVYDVLLPVMLQIPLNLSYNYYYMRVSIFDLNSSVNVEKVFKVKVQE